MHEHTISSVSMFTNFAHVYSHTHFSYYVYTYPYITSYAYIRMYKRTHLRTYKCTLTRDITHTYILYTMYVHKHDMHHTHIHSWWLGCTCMCIIRECVHAYIQARRKLSESGAAKKIFLVLRAKRATTSLT